MDKLPIVSHEFFYRVKEKLGLATLGKLYGRSDTQLYRWFRNPHDPMVVDVEKNPIDRMGCLLRMLIETGGGELARAGVAILANVVDCELVARKAQEPDNKSLAAEIPHDLEAVVAYHASLSNPTISANQRKQLLSQAKAELDDSLVLAVKGKGVKE